MTVEWPEKPVAELVEASLRLPRGGCLLDLTSMEQEMGPQPAAVLPFLEVAVGIDIRLQKRRFRLEVNMRNGTGELFYASLNPSDQAFSG